MNSLFISPDLGTNSSGNLVSLHELEFLKSISDNVIQLGYKDINPTVHNLPDNPFLMDYLTLDKVSQIDKLQNIDFCHLYAGPFTNTIRYLKAKGIKTFLSIGAHDRTESIKEFENLGYEYPYNHVKNDKLWKIYNGAVYETDVVIVPSKASAEFLKNEGVDETKVKIIPHGTDIPTPDKINPISNIGNNNINNINNNFKVGYLGQYGPDKGIKYLIQAWSSINYQDSTLIFGGIQSQKEEPFIRKYAVGGKYHLMGYVKDISDFYNNISVYVQPSVTEAFGIEILEAMSYGRPVIASEGAGASDLIENGINGFVLPIRDPKAISDKIDYLKNNSTLLIQMGQNAREKSLNYDWEIIKHQYIDLWNNSYNR